MDVEQLLEAAWPDAFRIALAITRDRGLAEDAAQNACLQAYRSFSQLRDSAAFRPWFYRMVVRSATSLAKRYARESQCQVDASVAEPPGVDGIALAAALGSLTPAQRAAVVLHYYADLNSREIAAVLGTSDGAVRFRLFLAKRKLREILATGERPRSPDEVVAHV